VIAGGVALVLLLLPTGWLTGLLDLADQDATAFLVRRYAASATAALCVATAGIARGANAQRAVLLGLATWFAAQAAVAVWGIATDTVGGLAWLALAADPLIAAWFYALSRRTQR
jgi:hypothetical protein